MQNLRYKDKRNLEKYDLCVDLFDRFDISVKDVIPVRDVFILCTDKGDKILKKADCCIDEIEYIYSAVTYIKRKFNRVFDFVKARDGKIYTIWNDDMYFLMDMVKGRECDFNNPLDIASASRGLAELHEASEGFRYNNPNKMQVGKMIDNFKRKEEEMTIFKSIAQIHEHKSEFDDIFIANYDFYHNRINKSIECLSDSPYLKISSEEDKIVLCHHDLAHHNILIYDDKAYFIDFDYAVIDIRVHDICNFMTKVCKNFAYDIEKAKLIIENYSKISSIDSRELSVLYGMLIFPEDFYNISKDYYTRRKDWDDEVFVSKIKAKIANKVYKEEFIDNFKKMYL